MFGLGMPEILMILVVALIFIGPKKLPDIAKSLGKAMGEFKKAANDLKDSINLSDEPAGTGSSSHIRSIDPPNSENKDDESSTEHHPDGTPLHTHATEPDHDSMKKEHREKKTDE